MDLSSTHNLIFDLIDFRSSVAESQQLLDCYCWSINLKI